MSAGSRRENRDDHLYDNSSQLLCACLFKGDGVFLASWQLDGTKNFLEAQIGYINGMLNLQAKSSGFFLELTDKFFGGS